MTQGQDKPSRRVSKGESALESYTDSAQPAGGDIAGNPLELLNRDEQQLLLWLMLDRVSAEARPALHADFASLDLCSPGERMLPEMKRTQLLHSLAGRSTVSALLELARLRAAEQLVTTQAVADLERMVRVIERLATMERDYGVEAGRPAGELQADLLDLNEMMPEVTRLLRELDQELPELPPADGDLYGDEPA